MAHGKSTVVKAISGVQVIMFFLLHIGTVTYLKERKKKDGTVKGITTI